MIRHKMGRGRCVFAGKDYKSGDVIEVCHCIHLNYKDTVLASQTDILSRYLIGTGEGSRILLGNGSLYNHSKRPNMIFHIGEQTVEFYALEDIKKLSELTINYGIGDEMLKSVHNIKNDD